MKELLPCPLCGNEVFFSTKETLYFQSSIVIRCNNCRLTMENIDTWNIRHSPWTSVKDRLPKQYESVLITYYSEVLVAHLRKSEGEYYFLSYDGPWIEFDNVKYWMPLPKLQEIKK